MKKKNKHEKRVEFTLAHYWLCMVASGRVAIESRMKFINQDETHTCHHHHHHHRFIGKPIDSMAYTHIVVYKCVCGYFYFYHSVLRSRSKCLDLMVATRKICRKVLVYGMESKQKVDVLCSWVHFHAKRPQFRCRNISAECNSFLIKKNIFRFRSHFFFSSNFNFISNIRLNQNFCFLLCSAILFQWFYWVRNTKMTSCFQIK